MDLLIEKKVSSGAVGETYIGKDRKTHKQYLVKKMHVLESDLLDTINILRIFNQQVAEEHPDHFMVCKSIQLIPSCEFQHPKPKWMSSKENQGNKWYYDLHKSKICLQMVYEPLLDDTLMKIYEKMNTVMESKNIPPISFRPEVYSILISIFYMHYLMGQKGWLHCDMHPGNIMCKKTNQQKIQCKLNGKIVRVPTFGKQWYVIDYDGSIANRKLFNRLHIIAKQHHLYQQIFANPHIWLAKAILDTMFQPWWFEVHEKKFPIPPVKRMAKKIVHHSKTRYFKKYLPSCAKHEKDTKEICLLTLCICLEPDVYFELFGMVGESWSRLLKATKDLQSVDKQDIIYCIKHLANHYRVIKYLAQKIKISK